MPQPGPAAELSRFERAALALGRFINERAIPKRIQLGYLNQVGRRWIATVASRRSYVVGLDELVAREFDRGVVLAANHRSFFDMYVVMSTLFTRRPSWLQRIYFPVRSNFFYGRPLGLAANYLVGGGAMYPPIFRDPAKGSYNQDALDRVKRFLSEPGTIVGMHPEGTRGKGPDPYTMLPAQPGIGQMVLHARPVVVPLFINGLTNDFVFDVTAAWRSGARRKWPLVVVFGEPLDYAELTEKKPRAALYKQLADKLRAAILALGERERALRARILSGEIGDDDPHWMIPARG